MAGLMAPTSLNLRQSFAGTSVGVQDTANLSRAVLRTPIRMAQSLQGKVVSTSAQKTAVVAVETFVPHRLYQKRIRQTKRYQAHDEASKCTVGDYVEINPCKPISRTKRFTIGEILRKSDL